MKKRVIAISGPPGAGSSTAGKILADKLKWQIFSAGQLFKDISLGIAEKQPYYKDFKELCDKAELKIPRFKGGNLAEATISLWNTDFGKSRKFHQILDELNVKLAERGNIVIEGKLALKMIPDALCKIWIKASLKSRATRTAHRDKIDLETAKKIITEREEKEREEWKAIYGFDYFEQEKDADIVIDSSEITPENVAQKIIMSEIFDRKMKEKDLN